MVSNDAVTIDLDTEFDIDSNTAVKHDLASLFLIYMWHWWQLIRAGVGVGRRAGHGSFNSRPVPRRAQVSCLAPPPGMLVLSGWLPLLQQRKVP